MLTLGGRAVASPADPRRPGVAELLALLRAAGLHPIVLRAATPADAPAARRPMVAPVGGWQRSTRPHPEPNQPAAAARVLLVTTARPSVGSCAACSRTPA